MSSAVKCTQSRFPVWLRRSLPSQCTTATETLLNSANLHTVCQSARCPNKSDCFARRRATFLILGNICTRGCSFCSVSKGKPSAVESGEPERIAQVVNELGLQHVVVTSVTRDDVNDGGAGHFALVVDHIKKRVPHVSVEVLCPDFNGNTCAIETVCRSKISIYNHNIETVPRLYASVRPAADFQRSMHILRYVKTHFSKLVVKSGFMVGLGESDDEVYALLDSIHAVGCDIVTIGQYLRPSVDQREVERFVTPEQFMQYENYGLRSGIRLVFAGPYVRSSFNAAEVFNQLRDRQ